jgi:hypothetical protein
MTNPNDPAFPDNDPDIKSRQAMGILTNGLTKREYFATMAMQGCVGREGHFYLYADPKSKTEDVNTPERYAQVAVACADALIAELNKSYWTTSTSPRRC